MTVPNRLRELILIALKVGQIRHVRLAADEGIVLFNVLKLKISI